MTQNGLLVFIEHRLNALYRFRLRGRTNELDRTAVQVFRGLSAAARQMRAHEYLINSVAHMGECKTRHAGDRSVIQAQGADDRSLLVLSSLCFSGLLCSLSLSLGSSSLLSLHFLELGLLFLGRNRLDAALRANLGAHLAVLALVVVDLGNASTT